MRFRMLWTVLVTGLVLVAFTAPVRSAERAFPLAGEVVFKPQPDTNPIPERFRLPEAKFSYQMKLKRRVEEFKTNIYELTFPSPYRSPIPANNTVHAEYAVPDGAGPYPGVIVLDITGGNQQLSRLMSLHFAQHGIAALFVQMAHYGPRRPPGSQDRLLSPDVDKTVEAVTQTVQDLRWATAWLEQRPEIDPKQLGIVGTSLGSFLAALTCEMEPRLKKVVIFLGGGGFVQGFYDRPEAWWFRRIYESLGGTREKLVAAIEPVDPLTCASYLKQRKCLIIAAKRDELVPPVMAEMLWKESGKQEIVWYDCTHYGAALFAVEVLDRMVKHFGSK